MPPKIIQISPDHQEKITNDIINKIFKRVSLPKEAIEKIISGIPLKPIIESVLNSLPVPKDGINGLKGDDGKDAVISNELISKITVEAIKKLNEVYTKPVDGKDGRQGEKGFQGLPGRDGLLGQTGAVGFRGTQGDQGDNGEKGDIGIHGLIGLTGKTGQQGEIGEPGNDAIVTDNDIQKVIDLLDLSKHVLKKDLDNLIKKLLKDLALGKIEISPQQWEGGGGLANTALIQEISRVLGQDDWKDIRTKFTADSLTVSVGALTGAVEDLQTAFDGNKVTIIEASSAPGYTAIIDFIDIISFNYVNVYLAYDGSLSHYVCIELWNWITSAWDCFASQTGTDSDVANTNKDFIVYDGINYVGTSGDVGKVRVRLNHPLSGNASHDIHIDSIALYK